MNVVCCYRILCGCRCCFRKSTVISQNRVEKQSQTVELWSTIANLYHLCNVQISFCNSVPKSSLFYVKKIRTRNLVNYKKCKWANWNVWVRHFRSYMIHRKGILCNWITKITIVSTDFWIVLLHYDNLPYFLSASLCKVKKIN